MGVSSDKVVIESRRGCSESASAPLAIMACADSDHRRICRMASPVAGSSRKAYNATLVEVTHSNRTVTVAGPILGAPQAALLLEKLIALGSRTIVVFGWCGSLQSHLTIGQWVLPTAARSEEGTSSHYPMPSPDLLPDAALLAHLQEYFEKHRYPLHLGAVWSTDAPLRETVDKVRSYGKEGVLAVEMEMSALFRVAAYRGIRLAGLLLVSDELSGLKWKPGFRTSRFKRSCRQATAAILDFCASLPPALLK